MATRKTAKPRLALVGVLTTREKLWAAMRELHTFSVSDLAHAAGVDRHAYRMDDYLGSLVRAGILGKDKQARFAAATYTLLRDLGVDAPRVRTVLAILAADGDRAYNFATVNTTLAAGSMPADRVRVCQGSMVAKGTEAGYTPDLGGQALPRGVVMYGMARQYMRDEAQNTGTDWSIQDGKVQMVPRKGYLPGQAVLLTHETGLIGTPEQTQAGITVRSLLLPNLRIGGRIKLDNKSVKRMQSPLKMAAGQTAPRLDDDGVYRILKVEFSGDTRGNDWYADMLCVGVDDTLRIPLDMAR